MRYFLFFLDEFFEVDYDSFVESGIEDSDCFIKVVYNIKHYYYGGELTGLVIADKNF